MDRTGPGGEKMKETSCVHRTKANESSEGLSLTRISVVAMSDIMAEILDAYPPVVTIFSPRRQVDLSPLAPDNTSQRFDMHAEAK